MSRLLSYTEITTALTCFAQWDFTYGGRLAGTTLKPLETTPRLSNGRAWGAAVQAWHAGADPVFAYSALAESLQEDARAMRARGFDVDLERQVDAYDWLGPILEHYMATAERLPGLEMIEGELEIPIRSRNSNRASTRYRFHCYLDGHTTMEHPWIVEFKLRDNLTSRTLIERQPQYRWYALAYAVTYGITGPVGVLVDERLNVAPKPARIVSAKRKGEGIDGKTVSHAADQITTRERYLAACDEYGVEAVPDVADRIGSRRWQQRVPLVFSPEELEEAARELTSAARLIGDLDRGTHAPIRNGKRANCDYCKFRDVCLEPDNHYLISSLYERTEPKRLRGPRPKGVR